MSNFKPYEPETQVRMLLKSIELRTECEDCGKLSFEVLLIAGCPYCVCSEDALGNVLRFSQPIKK
ncbi:MAG TPA: hypothetical protein VE954_28810 [Oligoflexus sp.]|uniref:hypothetical protein n=1 Tax=Oligoflexus sp. TaxID=1971216 RepID=UPI002D55231F|nr:hypothetical protein [Oligoflexus sp.]HYX37122.1 hypothetical protein [Oligoflexus sp.]